MEKKIFLSENRNISDLCNISQYGASARRTDVIVKDLDGKVLFRDSNEVIFAGSEFTAFKHFDMPLDYITPSYNQILGLDHSEPLNAVNNSAEFIYLFAIGDGGCGELNSNVYPVDYSKWITPDHLIPFRYQLESEDLTGELRKKYFGRKKLNNGRIPYYFKTPEAAPVLKRQYIDGTPVDSSIYTSIKNMEVECFVELNMKVLKEDGRDYYIATSGIENARVNQISLLSAYKTVYNGELYFQNIRPVTQYNFPNEPLIDLSKGLDITYHIYY